MHQRYSDEFISIGSWKHIPAAVARMKPFDFFLDLFGGVLEGIDASYSDPSPGSRDGFHEPLGAHDHDWRSGKQPGVHFAIPGQLSVLSISLRARRLEYTLSKVPLL